MKYHMHASARKQTSPDFLIILITLCAAMFGLIMIYSSSGIMASERFNDSFLFLKKQLLWITVGIGVMVFCMNIHYTFWKKYARVMIVLSFVLLVTVLVIGHTVGGARRWIAMGPFSFQPSELAKLTVVIGLAYFFDRKRSRIGNVWQGYLPGLVFVLIICGLILAEPDLGTPLVLLLVSGSLFFLSTAKITYLLATAGCFIPIVAGFILAVPYRRKRFLSFMDPWADPQGTGYQVIQSLIAIGSGGISGKGLGASEAKLLYIPEPHTDFIFSIVGEELGLIGAVIIILIYAIFAIKGLSVARHAPDFFSSFLAAGITLTIVYQALINIAVVSGCLPTKGLPLPFISFGGSSLLFTLAGVGILLNISQYTKK